MEPQTREDWEKCQQDDPIHFVTGKNGSIEYVPDQSLISGLIDRIKGRRAEGLEQELEGNDCLSQNEAERIKAGRKYFIPFYGNIRAILDAKQTGRSDYAILQVVLTATKYVSDGMAILFAVMGDYEHAGVAAVVGALVHISSAVTKNAIYSIVKNAEIK